jgi:hypothetical protein
MKTGKWKQGTKFQEKNMIEQSLLLKLSSPELTDYKTSRLRQESQAYQTLFQSQSPLVQQYLLTQANTLAEAIVQGVPVDYFSLPDHVVYPGSSTNTMESESIPVEQRKQTVGRFFDRKSHTSMHALLVRKFSELEGSMNRAVSTSAVMLRYAVARHIVHNMLPAGKSVIYASVDGDDIPNQPIAQDSDLDAVINFSTEAQNIVNQVENGPGELSVPYIEAARQFYLPQWVAFDTQGNLLHSSVSEAEACIASMQNYLAILDSAILIAPYMITDEIFQQKRYGMLGQLVNQGRALANYQSQEIIRTIQHRASSHRLDRGFSLSLPYFNDQKLRMEDYHFDVIPAGRVMFIPAFVVLAVRTQGVKVAQETRLNKSTRRHLLKELSTLEETFLR